MAAANTTLKLMSHDDKILEVSRSLASRSVTIRHLLEDLDDANEDPIPIPNVDFITLEKVVLYLQAHKDDPPMTEEQQQQEERGQPLIGFDAKFVDLKTADGKPDVATLFRLILAANFLDIKPLLDLTCKAVALLIKGKKDEEVRTLFGISTPFTKEEEDEVRKTNPWCDDKA